MQNDATLTSTLLCQGWQHRVRIKHESHSAAHNNYGSSSSSSRQGTGMVNNSEFLWECDPLLEDTGLDAEEDEDLDLLEDMNFSRGVW